MFLKGYLYTFCITLALSLSLCSCSNQETPQRPDMETSENSNFKSSNQAPDPRTNGRSNGEVSIMPISNQYKKDDFIHSDFDNYDTKKYGYGQGTLFDNSNRPQGALDFNAKYNQLGATAISENSDKIYLTFDQGYENGYTPKILDVLKEKGVRAVFFVLQDYAVKNPDLVKRMIDEGHIVGNHSVNHYSMPTLSPEECKNEIMDFHQFMLDNFNYTMKLFRPPMGEFSEQSLAIADKLGYQTVMWSFAYADWDVNSQPDNQQAMEKIVNSAHKGAIYLLHSVSKTNAEVLSQAIDQIRANGFEFA